MMKQKVRLNLTMMAWLVLFGFFMPELSQAGLREALPEIERGGDQTILLDEMIIRGDTGEESFQEEISEEKIENNAAQQRPSERPLLSTVLSWKGNEIIALDIPKEILEQLTRPDLSYVLEREAAQDDVD